MKVGALLLHNQFSTKQKFLSIDGLLSLKIDLDMPFWECSSKTIKMTYLYVFYEVGSLPLDTTIHYQRYISLKPWASISKNWLRYVILKVFAITIIMLPSHLSMYLVVIICDLHWCNESALATGGKLNPTHKLWHENSTSYQDAPYLHNITRSNTPSYLSLRYELWSLLA